MKEDPCEKISSFQNLLILKIIQKSIHHFILSKKRPRYRNQRDSFSFNINRVWKKYAQADVFRSHTSSVVVC